MTSHLDASEQKVVDDIRDYGCSVMHVFDADGDLPEFSYSIGFPETVEQPEVIVFGVKREVRHFMINEIQRQCVEGLKLQDGLRISGLIEGWNCVAKYVTDAGAIREHFGWALWYHDAQRDAAMHDAFQIVWPGAEQGLFPWEPDCDPIVMERQPALYEGAAQ
ncbi:DUF4262 domain-containing protein [Sphingopyxis sp. Root1497]|uniref:DUF4262 domain-containing protein n=1 Tax=Sphingopyxis sp. Root1497 TaxID=1736474 RepID=UPI000A5AA758|nr:DUF4262 domain-containing protein [Sphingopyxis sp. Root1497]